VGDFAGAKVVLNVGSWELEVGSGKWEVGSGKWEAPSDVA